MKTQNEKILNHLKKGKKITPISALKMFGCFRLSARIYNLIRQGYDIKMERITKDGKKFGSYYLQTN